ncbi:competence/damage-inducible protein A [Comamonas serinivorans]|uniref:Competence/damage-inducible protein A n=1 Tax=Comamonas serinivorans TaxID=1082851 RepID=A0A1Y0ETM4_9BURK|nr:molybdopterin-binding protein [Comamonas serinivorans]ARU06659.1 competence/damage-inducible protein A [Comamonas serinivorans]
MPRVGLIVVGDEILSGKRQDKHLAKCIELLTARGMSLAWAEYVGDDRDRIAATLARAFASGDVVLSTGGIGATPDDHTRQAAAQALGVPLALHPQAKLLIQARMREVAQQKGEPYEPERPDNLHRLNMGVFPAGASLVPNAFNRIPGFSCAGARGGAVHCFPGFPVMAWPMMAWVLDSYYQRLQRRVVQVERSVIILGAAEGLLTPTMEAIESEHPAVKVFSLPSVDHPEWGAHIELGVKGEAAEVEAAYADLRQRLAAFALRYGPELSR